MKKNNGQTLIEVLVAVFVISIVLVALMSAVTYSLRNANYAKNKSTATKYVEEGIEAVRSIKERDWSIFTAAQGTDKGLSYNSTNQYWEFNAAAFDNPESGSTFFKRVVRVSACTGTPITACTLNIKVFWNNRGPYDSYSEVTTIYSRF